jgi:hypothetical protein
LLGKKRRPSGGEGGALSRSENPNFELFRFAFRTLGAALARVMWLPATTSLTLDYCTKPTNDQCHHVVSKQAS